MKRFTILSLGFLLATLLFESCQVSNNTISNETPPSEENILAIYGEQIYKRESCANCHTQQIENSSQALISLDGVGNKYPDVWLYYYFLHPSLLKLTSQKSSYSNLYVNHLDEKMLLKIREEMKLKTSGHKLWDKLNIQAKTLSEKLDIQDKTINNTEVLALISYIQQIPSSQKMKEMDSLENIKKLEKQKAWDSMVSDIDRIIYKNASNNENINSGKLLFEANCTACHDWGGSGALGPNLTDDYWLHGGEISDIAKTIIYGVRERGMIPWKNQLAPEEVGKLISYISSLRGTNPKDAKAPEGTKQ